MKRVNISRARFASLVALASLLSACASTPKPTVLVELDGIRNGGAAKEAKAYAPGAFAHAEKIRKEADEAFSNGDLASAQILGERAQAAYVQAAALARVARAEALRAEADAKATGAKDELRVLEAEQVRAGADADALELRLRVARDAQAIVPSGKASPERERARLGAARSMALQARLLCGAAQLLLAGRESVDAKLSASLEEANQAVSKVYEKLGPTAVAAPIDETTRARAGCLTALTVIRRASTPVTRALGTGDALLAELSAAGQLSPSRDDRGVVVTLRGVFKNDALSPAGQTKIAELARVAAAHPTFPVAVVVHGDASPQRDSARAQAVAKALAQAAPQAAKVRVEAFGAGDAIPLVDPGGSDKARNARVEIVFVTPETF